MKKSLLFLMVLFVGLSVRAQNVVNTVTSYETVTNNSTVYVGEVVVDGQSVIKYLYSGDVTINSIVLQNLLAGLQGMADVDYATLLEQELYYITQNQDFALCADAELAAAMDENWISASYVGALYYPGLTVKTEINSNLYDLDEGFKAVVDEQIADRVATIDYPIEAGKYIVSHLDTNTTSSVYYTIEDGQIVKHIDTNVTFSCEVTTVIYTKVELESTATYSITLPESFENGSVVADKETAAEGETVTLTVTPAEGYELETLTIATVETNPTDGAPMLAPLRANVDYAAGENGTYTFVMPAAPVTINATFKETTVTGIVDLNTGTAKSGQRYNLMGQPVGKDYKGIVIEDGKKIIVK